MTSNVNACISSQIYDLQPWGRHGLTKTCKNIFSFSNFFQNRYANSCWAVSTQINIVIACYLRKLRNKSSVKHVHTDRNVTLNIEPLIAVLSGRCHFSDLVWFDVSKPLYTLRVCTKYTHHLRYCNSTKEFALFSFLTTDYLLLWSPYQSEQKLRPTMLQSAKSGGGCLSTYHWLLHRKILLSTSAECGVTDAHISPQYITQTTRPKGRWKITNRWSNYHSCIPRPSNLRR
jgi:hypothetical protein